MRTQALEPERDCIGLVATGGDLPHRGEEVETVTNATEFVARADASTRAHVAVTKIALRASHDPSSPG